MKNIFLQQLEENEESRQVRIRVFGPPPANEDEGIRPGKSVSEILNAMKKASKENLLRVPRSNAITN
ncbi:MAG: hypothetical protein O2840_00285 [bacterium]|nr:hypothetical protein [bacterium]